MSENQPRDRDNEEIFTLVDEKGNEELYKEAMRFKSDQNGKWYICLYPLDEENADEVDIEAFSFEPASDMDGVDSGDIQLMPIESDEEWAMVQEVLNTFIDDEGNFNA